MILRKAVMQWLTSCERLTWSVKKWPVNQATARKMTTRDSYFGQQRLSRRHWNSLSWNLNFTPGILCLCFVLNGLTKETAGLNDPGKEKPSEKQLQRFIADARKWNECKIFVRLIDWLIDRSIGWLISSLARILFNWKIKRYIDAKAQIFLKLVTSSFFSVKIWSKHACCFSLWLLACSIHLSVIDWLILQSRSI